MNKKIALVVGASGSVGFEVLKASLESQAFEKVIAFVRKPIDQSTLASAEKLIQKQVSNMTTAKLSQAVASTLAEFPDAEVVGFTALGVGAKTAKLTLAQHRAIDVDLNRAFAEALKQSPQVKYLGLLSAVGANPQAKETGSGAAGMPRYARVKGESEEAVKANGPKAIGIFRPATIRGSIHTPKIFDVLAPLLDCVIPQKYHSIRTQEIAQAMVAASLSPTSGTKIFEYPEMNALIRKHPSSN